MKIAIPLDADQIQFTNNLLLKVYATEGVNLPKSAKLLQSIAFDLSDKFESKHKSIVKKQNLLNAKDKYKISLKYHEAWALESLLHYLIEGFDAYAQLKLNQVILIINQKLA